MAIKPGDTVIRCGSAFSHPRVVKEIVGKFAHFKGGGYWLLDNLRVIPKVVEIEENNWENKKGPHQLRTGCGPRTTETKEGSSVTN